MKKVLALVVSGLALAGCLQPEDESEERTGTTAHAATATSTRFTYAAFRAFEIDAKSYSQGVIRPIKGSSRVVDPVIQLKSSSSGNSKAATVRDKLLAMSSRLVPTTCLDAKQQSLLCFRTPTGKDFTAAGSSSLYVNRAKSIPKGAQLAAQDIPVFRDARTGVLWAFSIHHFAVAKASTSTSSGGSPTQAASFTGDTGSAATTPVYTSSAGNALLGWYCQASGNNNDLTISSDSYAFFPGSERASTGVGDTFGARGDACLDTGDWIENASSGEWETVGMAAAEY